MADADDLTDLISEIARELEIEGSYIRRFHVYDEQSIERTRKAGRLAGKALGWKIRTHKVIPDQVPNMAYVIVEHHSGMTDEDAKRISDQALITSLSVVNHPDFGGKQS